MGSKQSKPSGDKRNTDQRQRPKSRASYTVSSISSLFNGYTKVQTPRFQPVSVENTEAQRGDSSIQPFVKTQAIDDIATDTPASLEPTSSTASSITTGNNTFSSISSNCSSTVTSQRKDSLPPYMPPPIYSQDDYVAIISVVTPSNSISSHRHIPQLSTLLMPLTINEVESADTENILSPTAGNRAHRNTAVVLELMFAQAQIFDDDEDYAEAYQTARQFAAEEDLVAAVWVAQCHIHGWGVPEDEQRGFENLLQLARQGVPEAWYPLACCYHDGVGTPIDFAEAFSWFEKSAEEGKSLAQYRVATLYAMGEGVAQDERIAFEWFCKSADNDNKYAQYIVGLYHEKGKFVPEDYSKAKEYFIKSAEQDFPDAQAALGCRLVEEGNYSDGLIWLQRAAQKENVRALLKLAIMYEQGDGIERNNNLAVLHYKAAANRDDPTAQYLLGLNYHLGELGLRPNPQEALAFLRKSAEQGFALAQRLVGMMYDAGTGVTRDHGAAFQWFRKAAAQGDGRAIGMIGSYYERGLCVRRDLNKALKYYMIAARDGSASAEYAAAQLLHRAGRYEEAYAWYSRAANHGRPSGKFMVARYILHGWGNVSKDEEKAFRMMVALSEEDGLPEAHLWVGTCYQEGAGVSRDIEKAFKYYLLSAENGDPDGQYQVGYMLSTGTGVGQDQKKALEWYTKAAEQSNPAAQNSLGVYYLKGVGTSQDLGRAREYFAKAASQYFPEAQNNLGALCASLGDYNQAIFWYSKAAKQGDVGGLKSLAEMYESGTGVPQNYETAFTFYEKAATQCDGFGDVESIIKLANYYEEGLGVDQNIDMALAHYLKAAQSRDAVATFSVGRIYHTQGQYDKAFGYFRRVHETSFEGGEVWRAATFMYARYLLYGPGAGKNADPELGAQLLLRLADEGYVEAYYWVANCYETGTIVERDLTKAIHWYTRSAEEAKDLDARARLNQMPLAGDNEGECQQKLRSFSAAPCNNVEIGAF